MANNVLADYQVKVEGPIFTGAIYGQMKRVIREVEDEIGDELVEAVQDIDDRTFRNPTGYARSQVRKHREGHVMTVDRSQLVYGPWLEDGGSRSAIFSGYHALRQATAEVDAKVPEIVAGIITDYLIR